MAPEENLTGVAEVGYLCYCIPKEATSPMRKPITMPGTEKFISVSRGIIEIFLDELKPQVDAGVAKRLRTVLLENGKASEKDLREALFPPDDNP